MKKRMLCLILAAVLLMGLFAGCSKKITVETDLDDMELDGPEQWKTGEDYKAELIPDDDYILPEKITVKVDGTKLAAKNYEYDPEDGDLTIPGEFVTGDIKISGEAEEITLIGKWTTDLDITRLTNYWLEEEQYMDPKDVNFSGLTIRVTLEFSKNGTYKVTVDKESVNELEEEIRIQLKRAFEELAQREIETYDLDMTVEELLEEEKARMGVETDEELCELLMAELEMYDFTEILTEVDDYGDYKEEDGMLELENAYDPLIYQLDGRNLTLKHTGSYDFVTLVFPIEFKRAS